jgi:hypothetical protein
MFSFLTIMGVGKQGTFPHCLPSCDRKIAEEKYGDHKMKQSLTRCLLLASFLCVTNLMVMAQASRTWVSGVGDDVNPCSRTAPCKTFAGAISKTAAGGEIDALDPGGYGAVTITKAVIIDGGGVGVVSALVSGTNGIVVSAGPSDVVTLRNLSINGIGTGLSGVRFLNGKALHIENCKIANFSRGIDIQPTGGGKVFVLDTVSEDNSESGIRSNAAGSTVAVLIDKSHFENNSYGVIVGDFSQFTVTNSEASGNSQYGFIAQANVGTASLNIVNSTAANNTSVGIVAGGGSANSTVRITGAELFDNGIGMFAGPNGSILSFGNNHNSGTGAPSGPISPQ